MWLQNLANFTNALAVPLAFLDNNWFDYKKKKKKSVKYLKSSSAKDPTPKAPPATPVVIIAIRSRPQRGNSLKATKEGVGGYQDPAEP